MWKNLSWLVLQDSNIVSRQYISLSNVNKQAFNKLLIFQEKNVFATDFARWRISPVPSLGRMYAVLLVSTYVVVC